MPPDCSEPRPGRGAVMPGRSCGDGIGRDEAVGKDGRDMFGTPPMLGRWKLGLGRCIGIDGRAICCGICGRDICGIEGRVICGIEGRVICGICGRAICCGRCIGAAGRAIGAAGLAIGAAGRACGAAGRAIGAAGRPPPPRPPR